MRGLIIAALVIGYPLTSASAETADGLKVLSSSKNSSSHRVIVGDVNRGEWVACWGLGSDGTPLGKGRALVKGKFVEVMIVSRTHHESIVDFYCEYEGPKCDQP